MRFFQSMSVLLSFDQFIMVPAFTTISFSYRSLHLLRHSVTMMRSNFTVTYVTSQDLDGKSLKMNLD